MVCSVCCEETFDDMYKPIALYLQNMLEMVQFYCFLHMLRHLLSFCVLCVFSFSRVSTPVLSQDHVAPTPHWLSTPGVAARDHKRWWCQMTGWFAISKAYAFEIANHPVNCGRVLWQISVWLSKSVFVGLSARVSVSVLWVKPEQVYLCLGKQ